MPYRLMALDIDGTIRTLERQVSERTREAVRRVSEAGAQVTLITGRMFSSALTVATELQITSPLVSYQGAHVADPSTGEVLMHRPMTAEMAHSTLGALDGWQGEIRVYHGDNLYVSSMTPWVEGYMQRNPGVVRVVGDLRELAGREPTRLAMAGEEGEVADLTRRLRESFGPGLYIARSLPHLCEVLHPGAGKHNALAWLCRYLSIPQGQTVAFGNGAEDAEMVRWAGLGVAVWGAGPELLESADRVAPALEEDGVAQVLEDLMDQGLVGR